MATVDEETFIALIGQFKSLPQLNQQVFRLQEVMRLAARAGNALAQECLDEDPTKLLANLHDAFMFRLAFPEWVDAGEK